MNKIIFALMLLFSSVASAITWEQLYKQGDASYVGGYYYTVCQVCLGGEYSNNTGEWACTSSTKPYTKGCAITILKAFIGKAGDD